MKEMPGIMSRMPALPVSINDDLASNLLSSTTQPITTKQTHSLFHSFSLSLSRFSPIGVRN
jgi:hypothetical protein